MERQNLALVEEPMRPCDVQGERRLLVAILDDAIQTCCSANGSTKSRRHIREAVQWIESRDHSWVFSFERICEALELDPEYLRRGVMAWREARLTGGLHEPSERNGVRGIRGCGGDQGRRIGPAVPGEREGCVDSDAAACGDL